MTKFRIVEQRGRYWAEELINGTWWKLDCTESVCTGNTEHALMSFIERRREELAKIYTPRVVKEFGLDMKLLGAEPEEAANGR